MNLIEQLQEFRKFAGLPALSDEQQVELAEKKLSGKEKEDFLAKMAGKKSKKVDGGSGEVASKASRVAMDKASIKGSVSGEKGVKMKKKVSEHLSDVLVGAGLKALSEADAAKVDAKYPDAE